MRKRHLARCPVCADADMQTLCLRGWREQLSRCCPFEVFQLWMVPLARVEVQNAYISLM